MERISRKYKPIPEPSCSPHFEFGKCSKVAHPSKFSFIDNFLEEDYQELLKVIILFFSWAVLRTLLGKTKGAYN